MTDEPPIAEPPPEGPPPSPRSGLEQFVMTRPMLSGFLTFLVIQVAQVALGSVLSFITSGFDTPVPIIGGTALVNLFLYVGLGVWGFRLGRGRFLVGLLLPVGLVLLLIGACIAIILVTFSGG